MSAFDAAIAVLHEGIAHRIFPAATALVGSGSQVLWRDAFGRLTFDEDSPPTELDTPFDLASLTKPIATTSALIELVIERTIALDAPVATFFEEWRGADREMVTVRDLLAHASGLSARLLDPAPEGRREFEHDICTMPLEYVPRSRSIYSDLGFILLGFVAADVGGMSLSALFDGLWVRMKADPTYERANRGGRDHGDRRVRLQPPFDDAQGGPELVEGPDLLTFELPADQRARAAPTQPLDEDLRRGRLLAGEVHDNYAAALGGVAGHAGLFGTVAAVGIFARTVLRAARGDTDCPIPFRPDMVTELTTRSGVAGSSRALGWDTMLPSSSCGERMSPSAFGHVGFTGTSLWIDPARDRYFVLLTNRACGGGTIEEMRVVRRAFHDALGDI